MLYTLQQYTTSFAYNTQKTNLLTLDLTDFEHFSTDHAHDQLQQLPN